MNFTSINVQRRGRAGALSFVPYSEDNTHITFLTLAIIGLIKQ
jgi:hypothetical protein